MKRKGFCKHLFATVLLLSVVSLSQVAWAEEIDAPDHTQTQAVTDTTAPTTESGLKADEKQPADVTEPAGQAVPEEKADEDANISQPVETKPTAPTTQNAVDAPYMVTPVIEISKEKDAYQAYEVIYVALTAPAGYTIYYSLDGSEATAASTQYTQPFAIEAPGAAGGSVTLHAIAIKSSDTM